MSETVKRRLFVTYDLNAPGQNYAGVEKAINELGEAIKPLETVWFVHTATPTKDCRDAIAAAMDSGDSLVVGRASEMSWRGLSAATTTWLKEHV